MCVVDSTEKIFVRVLVSYSVDSNWRLVRELNYLAITEDALTYCIKMSNPMGLYQKIGPSYSQTCSKGSLISSVQRMQRNSVRHDFVRCLCQRTYTISAAQDIIATTETKGIVRERQLFTVIITRCKDKVDSDIPFRRSIRELYENFRTSKQHSSHMPMNMSDRIDCGERPLWKGWLAGDQMPFNQKHLGKAFVYSPSAAVGDSMGPPCGKYCLYILDDSIQLLSPYRVIWNLLWTLHRKMMYTISRKEETAHRQTDQPNTRETYCVNIKPDDSLGPDDIAESRAQQDLCSWIRTLATTEGSGSGSQQPSLVSWRVSKAAIAAIGRPNGENRVFTYVFTCPASAARRPSTSDQTIDCSTM